MLDTPAGLQLGIGIFVYIITGVLFVGMCIWRKNKLNGRFKKMRQLSSTFFRRKRERMLRARELHQIPAPQEHTNTALQIHDSGAAEQGHANSIKKESPSKKSDTDESFCFVLTESKADPAYLTLDRVAAEAGIKPPERGSPIIPAERTPKMERAEVHSASKTALAGKDETFYDIKRVSHRTMSSRSTSTKSSDSIGDNSIKNSLSTNTGNEKCLTESRDIVNGVYKGLDDVGKKSYKADDDELKTHTYSIDKKSKANITENNSQLESKNTDHDSNEQGQSSPDNNSVHDDKEHYIGNTNDTNEKKFEESNSGTTKVSNDIKNGGNTNKNIMKGSKSMHYKPNHKWKTKYWSEHGRLGRSQYKNNGDESPNDDVVYDNIDKLIELKKDRPVLPPSSRDSDSSYQEMDYESSPVIAYQKELCKGMSVNNQLLVEQTRIRGTEELHTLKAKENAPNCGHVSNLKPHRKVIRRKRRNTDSESSDTDHAAKIPSQSQSNDEPQLKSGSKGQINPTLIVPEITYHECENLPNKTLSDILTIPEKNDHPNPKIKAHRLAIRRKSPLEMKTSDDSGYSSFTAGLDRQISELNSIISDSIDEISTTDKCNV